MARRIHIDRLQVATPQGKSPRTKEGAIALAKNAAQNLASLLARQNFPAGNLNIQRITVPVTRANATAEGIARAIQASLRPAGAPRKDR